MWMGTLKYRCINLDYGDFGTEICGYRVLTPDLLCCLNIADDLYTR